MKNISKFKKSRIVVPALALAVLTTTAAATSTVAWFAANGTVTASSLSMKATSSADLYIVEGVASSIKDVNKYAADVSSQSSNANATALKPADVDATTTPNAPVLRTANDYSETPTYETQGTVKTWTDIGTISDTKIEPKESATVSDYVAYANVSIARRTGSENANKFDLTITATVDFGTASALNKAVRAGVFINGAFYESNDNGVDTKTNDVGFTWPKTVQSLSNNTIYHATLLFWLEGDDTDCTQKNALTVSNNTIDFTFKSSEHVGS